MIVSWCDHHCPYIEGKSVQQRKASKLKPGSYHFFLMIKLLMISTTNGVNEITMYTHSS